MVDTICVEVRTVFESSYEAELMASLLLSKHLVASAHFSKIHSIHMSGDKRIVQKEVELSCITRRGLYDIVRGFIEQNCICDNCLITCVPVLDISKDYAAWVERQLNRD